MSVRTSDSGSVAVKETLHRKKYSGDDHKHPVNVVHHDEATFGEMLADGIASFIGSWTFLIVQTGLVAAWITINTLAVTGKIHLDPYPFILLNLAFSTQAAYTGPVLLLAGNRQAQKDRLTLEHAAHEADKADRQNVQILRAIERNTEVTIQILRHVESLVSGHMAEDAAAAKARDETGHT
ncbi:MAG TPA: DUF1003 domain-containing protein [Candidatus Limnocylindrales bacterium]|nr:DUF1003 domain-containing protein [Candidatus Limnocylindrales bacterium]